MTTVILQILWEASLKCEIKKPVKFLLVNIFSSAKLLILSRDQLLFSQVQYVLQKEVNKELYFDSRTLGIPAWNNLIPTFGSFDYQNWGLNFHNYLMPESLVIKILFLLSLLLFAALNLTGEIDPYLLHINFAILVSIITTL